MDTALRDYWTTYYKLKRKIDGFAFDSTNAFKFESKHVSLVMSTKNSNHFEINSNYFFFFVFKNQI